MPSFLDTAAIQHRLDHLPVEHVAAGQTLLATGGSTGKLYFLKDGAMEVVMDGVRLGVESEPGNVLGELSALLDRPHGADVRAAKDSTLHVASADMIDSDTALALYVATILAKRIEAANHALIEMRAELTEDQRRGLLKRIAAHLRYEGTEGVAPGYNLTPGPLLAAVNRLPVRAYEADDLVISAGEKTGKLHILEDAEVEVVSDGVQVGKLNARGTILGEIALLLDRPHGADVRTLTPSTIRIADGEAFLRGFPPASHHIAVITARRISAANQAVVKERRLLDPDQPSAVTRLLDRITNSLRIGAFV
ncbi:MAG: cyclic nucleotide-binding domain-containing protein [Pseudomonadota bacterium]